LLLHLLFAPFRAFLWQETGFAPMHLAVSCLKFPYEAQNHSYINDNRLHLRTEFSSNGRLFSYRFAYGAHTCKQHRSSQHYGNDRSRKPGRQFFKKREQKNHQSVATHICTEPAPPLARRRAQRRRSRSCIISLGFLVWVERRAAFQPILFLSSGKFFNLHGV
jgi:hypothetical protein